MRIISGILKGKSINFIKNSTTRPLKDAVRETMKTMKEKIDCKCTSCDC